MRKSASQDCTEMSQTIVLNDSEIEGDIILPGNLCLSGGAPAHHRAGSGRPVSVGAKPANQPVNGEYLGEKTPVSGGAGQHPVLLS